MRILAANPDGLGDMILRQPLYAALQAAGHKLMLTVAGIVARWPHMSRRGPSWRALTSTPISLPSSPNGESLSRSWKPARQFEPQLFLVTPYQWTLAEEWLRGICRMCR